MMTNYKILEYRSREEVDSVLNLLDLVATKDEFGRSITENEVTIPRTHTRQGKGQRRKKLGRQQQWKKQG